MDKFKEKLNALRIEADNANARATESEQSAKKAQEALAAKELEVQSYSNKVSLLTAELERAESRIESGKANRAAEEQIQRQAEEYNRKITLLENELETAQRIYRETNEK